LSVSPSFAAPKISTISCGSPIEEPNWPRNVFRFNCSATVSGIKSEPLSLGVYTSNYNTTRVSGNGRTIDYRQPENPIYRLRADGPLQNGIPENITTQASKTTVTMVVDNIRTNTTYDFDLLYTTYEADLGDTDYKQNFTVGLYSKGNLAISSKSSSVPFTIQNKSYITVSGPIRVIMTPDKIFSFNNIFDSNFVTVTLKCNNTWKLQTKLLNDLVSNGNTILASSNYFQASGTGFVNLASSPVRFLVKNTLYDAAQETSGVYSTGTTDNINLRGLDIIFKYSFKNTQLFKSGDYTTDGVFNLISPF